MTKTKILLYGQDEPLLYTRGLVLKSHRFEVEVTCDVRHLEQALDAADHDPGRIYLLLLCHSVPGRERHRLVALTRQCHSQVAILQIVLPTRISLEDLQSDLVDATRGPETLIGAVEQSLSQAVAAHPN